MTYQNYDALMAQIEQYGNLAGGNDYDAAKAAFDKIAQDLYAFYFDTVYQQNRADDYKKKNEELQTIININGYKGDVNAKD